jgi:UDP-glucose 4-epimerase
MRILLTGGTGYIGSHTAITLSEAGHDVILLDNLYNSQFEVLARIEEILNKKMQINKLKIQIH